MAGNPDNRTDSLVLRHESEFMSAARFLMIAGLVVHHMFEIPGSRYYPREPLIEYSHLVPDFLNGFVHMAFMTAVPLLSVISGFLFFRRSRIDFREQLGKRFMTVALPAWLWALLWVGVAYAAHSAGVGADSFGRVAAMFDDLSLYQLANAVIGIDAEPYAFQFWFVHDLILTLALTPLIYWPLRTLGLVFLGIAFVAWLAGFVPPLFFSFNVLFFFCLGAYLGLPAGPRLASALAVIERFGWYVVPVFAAALAARLLSHELGALGPYVAGFQFLCLLRLLGVLAFSRLLLAVVSRGGAVKDILIRYSGYSFFVFAAHYPTVSIVKLIVQRLPGSGSVAGFFVMWIAVPTLTITACVIGGKLLERFVPPAFRLLNGGRAGQARQSRATAVAVGSSASGG